MSTSYNQRQKFSGYTNFKLAYKSEHKSNKQHLPIDDVLLTMNRKMNNQTDKTQPINVPDALFQPVADDAAQTLKGGNSISFSFSPRTGYSNFYSSGNWQNCFVTHSFKC